jgi:hypothetical protein
VITVIVAVVLLLVITVIVAVVLLLVITVIVAVVLLLLVITVIVAVVLLLVITIIVAVVLFSIFIGKYFRYLNIPCTFINISSVVLEYLKYACHGSWTQVSIER